MRLTNKDLRNSDERDKIYGEVTNSDRNYYRRHKVDKSDTKSIKVVTH